MHRAEDRCGRSDTDRQCSYGDQGEPRAAHQPPRRITNVLNPRFQLLVYPHVALPMFGRLMKLASRVFELCTHTAQRFGARVGQRITARTQMLDACVDQRVELFVDLRTQARLVLRTQSEKTLHQACSAARIVVSASKWSTRRSVSAFR